MQILISYTPSRGSAPTPGPDTGRRVSGTIPPPGPRRAPTEPPQPGVPTVNLLERDDPYHAPFPMWLYLAITMIVAAVLAACFLMV